MSLLIIKNKTAPIFFVKNVAFLSSLKTNKNLSLLLYLHRKLENAIHIYKKYDFKDIPVEKPARYERADIKMEVVF